MNRILIVDDEQSILDSISMVLISEGYETDSCLNGPSALQKVMNTEYDLILLDIKMPRMDGIEVLEKLMEINKDLVVIMISGHGTIETAVEATKKGAYNFLQKPLPDLYELKLTIKNAINYKKSKDEIKRVKTEFRESNRIIGRSEKMKNVLELVRKFSKLNSNVLITGESGTGKELIARQIHIDSDRADKHFFEINSANLTEDKIDREIFGIIENEIFIPGKFEIADGGTIFFDEISNLSNEVQTKLLNVIESNSISRIGSNADKLLDLRFIFGTKENLSEEVKEKRLREDFYHRINVLQIDLPPLRERPEDIIELLEYFTEKLCFENRIPLKSFSPEAKDLLLSFRWPGNVRELKNLIERVIITVNKNNIEYEDIELPGSKHLREFSELFNKNMPLNEFQNESEKIFILKMLNDYKFNISQTADALQIQRSHIYKLMTKYNIPKKVKIK
ncbi:MAG TPA: sigma-54 dependent transcriptional regulator [Ignavibacteria bacterium]|nr:sigma-54 dependent transcriptional regulator [Ignavibacteria bacterium]